MTNTVAEHVPLCCEAKVGMSYRAPWRGLTPAAYVDAEVELFSAVLPAGPIVPDWSMWGG